MKKTGIVWEVENLKLKNITKNSGSFSDILRKLGLGVQGGNMRTLKKRLIEDEVDFSHIISRKNKKFGGVVPYLLSEVMVRNSTYARCILKKRLLKEGILENKCSICDQESEWKGQKLIMVLDHINGVNNDHRLENLRMVCPNCNSQLPTFCGKHNKVKNKCIDCGKRVNTKSSRCLKCYGIKSGIDRRKVKDRPSKEEIKEMQKTMTMVAIGKKYGVSDNAVRKWLK